MSKKQSNLTTMHRRSFVKASLIPALAPLATSLAGAQERADGNAATPPEIIDTNVHLFEWPMRRLKYRRTPALVAKLRRHRIVKAWAGSFEAVLHKQLDAVNRRLAEECRNRGDGMLVPFGSVNPTWADWREDLRRCHEQYGMPGVRLYPAYHGYGLEEPPVAELIAEMAKRGLLVQIALRMEDERVHHAAFDLRRVNVAPLADVLPKVPVAKVQLINAAGPLLGNNLQPLVQNTQVMFDIAATEGNGGVGRLIEGKNYSYRGAIPSQRLLFGSHAPFFPCESAVWKLFESPLSREQLEQVMHANARRLLG